MKDDGIKLSDQAWNLVRATQVLAIEKAKAQLQRLEAMTNEDFLKEGVTMDECCDALAGRFAKRGVQSIKYKPGGWVACLVTANGSIAEHQWIERYIVNLLEGRDPIAGV